MRTLVSVLPRRLGHIGLVGMLVLVGSITNGAGASAAETKPCEAPTVESFHQFKVEAVKAKYSDHAIKRKISERWCSLVDITIPMNDPIGTMTSPGDVDWTGMSIFWDNQVGKYYATADWHWTNQGFIDHDYVTCIDNEIGYNDGVGIRFRPCLVWGCFRSTV